MITNFVCLSHNTPARRSRRRGVDGPSFWPQKVSSTGRNTRQPQPLDTSVGAPDNKRKGAGMMSIFKGAGTALATPFNDQGIDFSAFEAFVEFQIEKQH